MNTMTAEQNPIITALEAQLAEIAHLDADANIATMCWKCSGQGYGGWMLDGGRCWNCNATGRVTRVVRNIRRSLKAEITIERQNVERVAKIQAEYAGKLAKFTADHGDVVKALAEWNNRQADNYFLADMASTLKCRGSLTDKQADAVRSALKQIAGRNAEHEAAESVPTGRVVITGKVISLKTVESQYGNQYKMLVLDDRGFKVFGTEPSSISPQKDDRVTFTAKCEPSNDDPKFGFYSRPTKAEILDEG
jgi:hypothetical protein